MVRPSAKGFGEQRDTSQHERGNASLRDADPHCGGDKDEHDDWDDYWSGASLQGASGEAPDVGTARSIPGSRDSDATEDEKPHSYQS